MVQDTAPSGDSRIGTGEFSAAPIEMQLERILHSRFFSNAPSLSRFLRYLVEHAIQNGADKLDQLKEYTLGVEVFDRGESFDSRIDTIVRAQARRLRSKLKEYYQTEGRTDPIVIELPKGRYVVVFRPGALEPIGSKVRIQTRILKPIALTLLGAAAVSLLWLSRGDAPSPGPESIAVLPFENLSRDPSQDYLADGMTEALITKLGTMGSLRVISRSAVTRYKGSHSLRFLRSEIARQLNAGALVEGSLLRSGDRVRIVVRMVDPKTQRQLWSDSYETGLRDFVALQEEVARAIDAEIRGGLTAYRQAKSAGSRPVDWDSYDSYLRGLFHSRRENSTDNKAAIMMFERAVSIDPSFAAAHAELARSYVHRFFLFMPGEKQWEEKAFVAVKKALALEPDLAEAHRALGRLLWTPEHRFPHENAIREYRRALKANPSLEEVHHELGLIYSHIGLLEEAIQELEKELAINPLSAARLRIGQALLYQGKPQAALAIFQGISPQVNPAIVGFHVGWALFQLGRRNEALAKAEEILRDHPIDAGGLLSALQAMMLAARGDRSGAEAKIKTALEKGKGYGHFHHTAYGIACAYAFMHKGGPTVQWLETAAQEGFPCYPLYE